MFFSISVVYIKEEPNNAAFLLKNGFNRTNCSIAEIDIKEEPLQDDSVSELLNRKKLHRNFL